MARRKTSSLIAGTACEHRLQHAHVYHADNDTLPAVGPKELELIQASGWREFPPRLPDQPIFYPVTNEDYAVQIARDWNVKASGAGFVTKFEVQSDYLSRFSVQPVGGARHTEYWIPAEDLRTFNENIVGEIQVIREFR